MDVQPAAARQLSDFWHVAWYQERHAVGRFHQSACMSASSLDMSVTATDRRLQQWHLDLLHCLALAMCRMRNDVVEMIRNFRKLGESCKDNCTYYVKAQEAENAPDASALLEATCHNDSERQKETKRRRQDPAVVSGKVRVLVIELRTLVVEQAA